MSVEAMSFILGGLLIAVGLFGGGIEVKEMKIPPVGQIVRGFSLVVGLVFIGLAVLLNLHLLDKWFAGHTSDSTKLSDSADNSAKRGTFAFDHPMQGDLRLDICYEWGSECGEKTATAWCKSKGFARAIEYPTEKIGIKGTKTTRIISNQAVCDVEYCDSFSRIVCER